jgi:DNA-binding Lrp family transcriptional regulator
MSRKIQSKSVEPYYQVPKIVAQFDKMTNDHIIILMHLYDQLRQKKEWNKTNKELADLSKVSMATLKRKLNDLEEWGFLDRKGMSFNRKFSLGNKFDTRSSGEPGSKSTRSSGEPDMAQERTRHGSPEDYIDNNSFKNLTNQLNSILKPQKPKKQQWDPLTDEQKDLIKRFNDGESLTDRELTIAKALSKRNYG